MKAVLESFGVHAKVAKPRRKNTVTSLSPAKVESSVFNAQLCFYVEKVFENIYMPVFFFHSVLSFLIFLIFVCPLFCLC